MVIGKNKDLSFSSKSAKRWGMQNTISVSFETCAQWVGFFGDSPIARFARASCETAQ
jgi:hypothetical protein